MSAEQLPLLPVPPLPRKERHTELAAKRDLRGLRGRGDLSERQALAEVALVLARAVDRADREQETWAAAAAARELRQVYALLLEPTTTPDELDRFLDELRTPLGDTTPA
jgi:hypothetical protein